MTVDRSTGTTGDASPASGRPPILRVTGLSKSFDSPRGVLRVLTDVTLSVAPGEFVAITGASGSGKSTLLHLMGGLDRPDSGGVELEGVDLFALSGDERAELRNRTLGFVFQFHHLLPEFSAVENVMMPALISGRRTQSARQRALSLLEVVGLAERVWHRPSELSGGEQQRVAVARALVNEPSLVLADEPTGNLDPGTSAELYGLFDRLRQELGQTLVVVTHEPDLAAIADRTLALRDGTIGDGHN